MSKQSFESILEKYLAGKCTPAEKQLVEQWYDLIGNEAKIPDTNEEWESLKTRMWVEIQRHQISHQTVTLPFYKTRLFNVGMAASILLFVLLGIYQFSSRNINLNLDLTLGNSLETIVNQSDKNKLLHLEDGSSIRLFPKSKLSYPKQFRNDKREVFLEGEAFFEIAKNPAKPFYVYTNQIVTKVIGTSFFVKANRSDKQIQVLVRSGKVSVFKKEAVSSDISRQIEGVVILPNQQLNFDIDTKNFTKTVIEKPAFIANKAMIDFNFEDTSASEVLKKIQEAYGVSIIFDEELLKQCPFTADLNDEPLYGKISLLCKAIEATYETIDGQIVITGKGCK